jgi:hypothetical protein
MNQTVELSWHKLRLLRSLKMRVEELKNYGKGLLNAVIDAEGLKRQRETSEKMRQELCRELGHEVYHELMSRVKLEVEHMKSRDWSVLSQHGLRDGKFIEGVIRRIALMKAMADMVGMEKASEIQCRLLEKTMYESMSPMWPSVEDYYACGDFFVAFKKYTWVAMEQNQRAGLHVVEMVEDSPCVLAFNVKYCVWHEVAKAFGNPYLCYPSTCYGDEVTIPRVLGMAGPQYQFKRSGTLAQGASVCDFRYEVIPGI